MTTRHHYLELKEGDNVLKRTKTSLASETRDRVMLRQYLKKGQQIIFVVSSCKEKLINNL